MKKWIALAALSCLLLAGCNSIPEESTNPTPNATSPSTPTASVPVATAPSTEATVPSTEATVPTMTLPLSSTFEVYYPDEDFIEFVHKTVTLEGLSAQAVLDELIAVGIVNSDVTANSITLDGTQLNLDLSGSFLMQMYSLGTTGEHFVIGSIVNTFLGAYGAETILITADGSIIDSGHVVYDFPLSFFE